MEQRSATCYIFTVLPPAGRELLRVVFRDLPAAFLPVIQIGVFRHLAHILAERDGPLSSDGTSSLWLTSMNRFVKRAEDEGHIQSPASEGQPNVRCPGHREWRQVAGREYI